MKDLAVTQLHLLRQAIVQSGQKIGIIDCAHGLAKHMIRARFDS